MKNLFINLINILAITYWQLTLGVLLVLGFPLLVLLAVIVLVLSAIIEGINDLRRM